MLISQFHMVLFSLAKGCGHIKAVQWYADAVRNESKYRATECANCFAFMRYGYCKGNNRIYLGPHVDTNT